MRPLLVLSQVCLIRVEKLAVFYISNDELGLDEVDKALSIVVCWHGRYFTL